MEPYEVMLQLLAKRDDPFSGGRTYYAHPSLKDEDKPKMIHQSSATGMQAIPTTGIAQGIQYLRSQKILDADPIVVCSLGDGSVTEGEVAEAFQMAVLLKLPVLYLVQDNDWGISASGDEMRAMNAYEYAAGFKGMKRVSFDGSEFETSYAEMGKAISWVRKNRKPMLVHASVPLLGHHTSGVRSEWYRDDLEEDQKEDPFIKLEKYLLNAGYQKEVLNKIKEEAKAQIFDDFKRAKAAEEPPIDLLESHVYAPTEITDEVGGKTSCRC